MKAENPKLQGPDGEYLDLRDYFAAAALTGLIATPKAPPDCDPVTHERLAQDAYWCADAMLKARNT